MSSKLTAFQYNKLREERGCFYCSHIDKCDPENGCKRKTKPTQKDLDKQTLNPNL